MAKKLSTAEILAQLRGEVAGGEGDAGEAPDVAGEAPEVAGAPPEVATDPPAEPAAPAAAAPASGATSDILAALRAEAKGGGAPAEEAPAEPTAAAPAAGGGAPKSTSDILAALRAEKAGGAAPAAPAGGEAKPAPAKSAPAAMPAGEKPSVEEMVKAARGDAPAETSPLAPEKPALPPMPTKPPAPSKKKAKEPETRRNFLVALVATPFAAAWTMFTATCTAATLGIARFMMPNVLVEPPSTFKVGPPSDFPPGTVSTKFKAQFGVWIVRAEFEGQELLYALSTVCTHLGCTPNWLEGEQKFKCPCHGSGFYITGINFEGPAPRPLERHGIRVAPDGMVEVDKSRKFQQELGQWEDGACKVEVA